MIAENDKPILFLSQNSNGLMAKRLFNGDIFTVQNQNIDQLTLEFFDSAIYELEPCGYDEFMQIKWRRTGKTYTVEKLNEYVNSKREV